MGRVKAGFRQLGASGVRKRVLASRIDGNQGSSERRRNDI